MAAVSIMLTIGKSTNAICGGWIFLTLKGGSCGQVAILVTYSCYATLATWHSVPLGINRFIGSLTLITMITEPASLLVNTIPTFLQALASLDRIRCYLESADSLAGRRHSSNLCLEDGTYTAESILPSEKSARSEDSEKPISSPIIMIREGSFGWSWEKPCLEDLSFTLCFSEVHLIVGRYVRAL